MKEKNGGLSNEGLLLFDIEIKCLFSLLKMGQWKM
jgi:hypothetical protein